MIRQIQLTNRKIALVDDSDFALICNFKWRCVTRGKGHIEYAVRSKPNGVFYMHREILNSPRGSQVDHINGNGLDNRRQNLRICSFKQNHLNSRPKNGGRFKGVFITPAGNWTAKIGFNGRLIHLGTFNKIEIAALEYDKAAKILFGEFARLNFKTHYPTGSEE